jgi:cytochrome d ubiquinol oxidase subunit I
MPGLVASLFGFAAVYLIVFGAGLVFLLRMMSKPPVPGEPPVRQDTPTRAAGLAAAPVLDEPSAPVLAARP